MIQNKVGIIGCTGRMGKALVERFLANNVEGLILSVLHSRNIDNAKNILGNIEGVIFTDEIEALVANADVIIDFTRPSTSLSLLEACAKSDKNVSIVCGTTGFSEDEMEAISSYAKTIAVFYAANMSLGISVLSDVAVDAIRSFQKRGVTPDISILERHHKAKVDKPSGTAKMLANNIMKETNREVEITSLRYGKVVGDHDVIISTDSEVLTVSHHALNRNIFVDGAIAAAKYILNQLPGKIYSFSF